MDKSSKYLTGINEEILNLIDSRDSIYGLGWKDPNLSPLPYFSTNIDRKAKSLSYLLNQPPDIIKLRKSLLLDSLNDLIGYAYLLHWRVTEGEELK